MERGYSVVGPLKYDRGFVDNIIGDHDRKIKNTILPQLNASDIFINTTWIELNDELISILENRHERIFCYSGPDWESTKCRPNVHNFLKKFNPIYIGNTHGKNYFSFWLDFVYNYKSLYNTFDYWTIDSNIKTFMCLNRKPHKHRIELVKNLFDKNLIKDNFVSLGTDISIDNYKNLPVPIKLNNDIVNTRGDQSVAGNAGGITNDITSLGYPNNWNNHFLNVVTETTVHTDVFLSEKVFKPIIGMRPFVILGDDKIYDVLHNWGFDTFDDLFGTGYREKYYTDRITWITDVIENLEKENNLNKLLLSIKNRLAYNRNLFDKIAIKNRLKIYNLELQ
jgi:hypothetical protein